MFNIPETDEKLGLILNSLTNEPDYLGIEDRRLYEFYTFTSNLWFYQLFYHRETINQIDNLISPKYMLDYHQALSARLMLHVNQSQYANMIIGRHTRSLYDHHHFHLNYERCGYMSKEEKINEILRMEEIHYLLTLIETKEPINPPDSQLTSALLRYRQLINHFKSEVLDIIPGVGITALIFGLHFTGLLSLLCLFVALSVLIICLTVDSNLFQPYEYCLMAEIADDIELSYKLK